MLNWWRFYTLTHIEAAKGVRKKPQFVDKLVFTPNMHAPFQTFNNGQHRIINKEQ